MEGKHFIVCCEGQLSVHGVEAGQEGAQPAEQ